MQTPDNIYPLRAESVSDGCGAPIYNLPTIDQSKQKDEYIKKMKLALVQNLIETYGPDVLIGYSYRLIEEVDGKNLGTYITLDTRVNGRRHGLSIKFRQNQEGK